MMLKYDELAEEIDKFIDSMDKELVDEWLEEESENLPLGKARLVKVKGDMYILADGEYRKVQGRKITSQELKEAKERHGITDEDLLVK